jgi:hypothetical protein
VEFLVFLGIDFHGRVLLSQKVSRGNPLWVPFLREATQGRPYDFLDSFDFLNPCPF